MLRTGLGFDIHRFRRGRALILGGVKIPHPVGLYGHSDADVVTHAIMDALLGAAVDGDMGRHFPPTDPQWKDARSVDLLRRVMQTLRKRKMRIVHVDTVILAERPRIAPHASAIQASLARAMGITPERLSIKATTLEGLGALGEGKGLAALAVATVEQGPLGRGCRQRPSLSSGTGSGRASR